MGETGLGLCSGSVFDVGMQMGRVEIVSETE